MAYIKLEDLQKFPIRIDHYDKENGNIDFVLGIESVIEYAESLPTADVVEVKHGEWLWDTEDIYECSVCGIETRVDEVMGMPTYKYCPNCGADMRGGKEE